MKTILSQAEIDALNRFQHSGQFHPYTCGSGRCTDADHKDGEGILIATADGWVCPYCDYRQEYRDLPDLVMSAVTLWQDNPDVIVKIRYRNWRGEVGVRRILPRSIRFASTEWYSEPQWLLEALDVDKVAERSFAMKDILEWRITS